MTYVKTYLLTLKPRVINLKRDAKDLSRDLQRLEVRGKLGSKTLYYMSSPVSGQDEPNLAQWFATRAGARHYNPYILQNISNKTNSYNFNARFCCVNLGQNLLFCLDFRFSRVTSRITPCVTVQGTRDLLCCFWESYRCIVSKMKSETLEEVVFHTIKKNCGKSPIQLSVLARNWNIL